LGFTWYPAASLLSVPVAVAVIVLVSATAGLIGSRNTAKALSRPLEARFDSADRPARWWHVVPFLFGIGMIGFTMLSAAGGSRRSQAMDGGSGAVLIFGVVLATVGLLVALRPMLTGLARWTARTRAPLPVRLAARRVEHEATGLSWHLAGLALLVLIASVGAGVMRQTELSATPDGDGPIALHLYGNEVPAAARQRVYQLSAAARWLTQPSITEPPGQSGPPTSLADRLRITGAHLVTADCVSLRRLTGQPLSTCRDGQTYRLRSTTAGHPGEVLPAGTKVRFRAADGSVETIAAPQGTLDVSDAELLPSDLAIVQTRATPSVGFSADAIFFYLLPPGITHLDRFASDLASAAPASTMSVFNLDLDGIEDYRVHRGVVESGIAIAFLLGIAAFLVSAVGRAIERRREVTSLVVIGVRRRMLRAVQWWQLLTPLALVMALALFTGHLAGNAVLLLQGGQHGWFFGTVTSAGPLAAVAVAIAVGVGSFVVGVRPRPEDLRRE
jgi:hypothetical protein